MTVTVSIPVESRFSEIWVKNRTVPELAQVCICYLVIFDYNILSEDVKELMGKYFKRVWKGGKPDGPFILLMYVDSSNPDGAPMARSGFRLASGIEVFPRNLVSCVAQCQAQCNNTSGLLPCP